MKLSTSKLSSISLIGLALVLGTTAHWADAGVIGAEGDLYVSSYLGDNVVQFDGTTGALVGTFATLDGPAGLLFKSNGNLLVAGCDSNDVREFYGATGALIRTFAKGGELDCPTGLAFAPNGNLLVANFYGDNVLEFDGSTGALIGTFASSGLDGPEFLLFGPNGNLFVDSWFNDRVLEFDRTTGAPIGTFASSELDGPFGIAFRPNGNLLVSNYNNHNLLEYDGNTRAFVGVFGTAGPTSGPGDLEYGPNGNLFNADWIANTVEEFDGTTGAWVGTFASGGALNRPYYLVFKPRDSAKTPIELNEDAKLTGHDSSTEDYFGINVAISGDRIVVTAWGDDDVGSASGSAYVFHRSGGLWVQQAKLPTPSGLLPNDQLGRFSVTIDKDVIVVGAWVHSDAAWVYRWNGSMWAEEAKLLPSDGPGGCFAGGAVAVRANTIVVGDDCRGAVYVFNYDGSRWTETQRLPAAGRVSTQGYPVTISEDEQTIATGDWADSDIDFDVGAVYVYRLVGGTWIVEQKLNASDATRYNYFGVGVEVSGNTLVAGASWNGHGSAVGKAYVFERSGSTWSEVTKLVPSDGAAFDWFGESVTISGDTIVIAAEGADSTARDSGAAYVYQLTESGWNEVAKLVASDGAAQDSLGGWPNWHSAWSSESVGISGRTVVVGAPFDDDAGANSGSVYVFDLGMLPSSRLPDLVEFITSLNLQNGIENSLDAKLEAALQALEDVQAGNNKSAINVLSAFIQQVEAQRGNQIPVTDADLLIAEAQEIIDLLSG